MDALDVRYGLLRGNLASGISLSETKVGRNCFVLRLLQEQYCGASMRASRSRRFITVTTLLLKQLQEMVLQREIMAYRRGSQVGILELITPECLGGMIITAQIIGRYYMKGAAPRL